MATTPTACGVCGAATREEKRIAPAGQARALDGACSSGGRHNRKPDGTCAALCMSQRVRSPTTVAVWRASKSGLCLFSGRGQAAAQYIDTLPMDAPSLNLSTSSLPSMPGMRHHWIRWLPNGL